MTTMNYADDIPPYRFCMNLTANYHMFGVVYKKNQMSTDRDSGRGNKRARVTRGSRVSHVIITC
jgi:hypothetical protein